MNQPYVRTVYTPNGPVQIVTTPARQGAARFVQVVILIFLGLIVLTGFGCALS